MHEIPKSLIKKFIERNYDTWGTKIETKLPAEFVISEHAYDRMTKRLCFKKEKLHKIMLKAWNNQDEMNGKWLYQAQKNHGRGIYKQFNGNVFVFRIRRNYKLRVQQKFLITAFKKKGFQYHS